MAYERMYLEALGENGDRAVAYDGEAYEKVRTEEQEEDDYITNPAEVEEGALQCRCGSKRTVSVTLQTSSGDESTAVWAQCTECKRKWRA